MGNFDTVRETEAACEERGQSYQEDATTIKESMNQIKLGFFESAPPFCI